MTHEERQQHQASDDGMPAPPALIANDPLAAKQNSAALAEALNKPAMPAQPLFEPGQEC